MVYRVIMISAYLLIIGISYFSQKQGYKYKNGKILLTTIPLNEMESKEVIEIKERGLKSLFNLHIIFFLLGILMLFVGDMMLIISFLVLILCYIFFLSMLSGKYVKMMRKLKKEKNFKTYKRHYVDIKMQQEILKSKIPLYYWILPILVYVLGYSFIGTFQGMDLNLGIMSLIYILIIVLISNSSAFNKIKIISSDRELNITLNKFRNIKIQDRVFRNLNVFTVIFLISTYYQTIYNYSFIPMLVTSIIFLDLITYIFYELKKADTMFNENIEDDKYIIDDDEYYDIWGYKNPNDKRIFITDPSHDANIIINRGNKAGKIINNIFIVLIFITVIFAAIAVMPQEYAINITKENIKISTLFYKDNVKIEDISNISILEKMPNEKTIRTNGVSTAYQNYGNFDIKGEGKVRLYLYTNEEKVIKIERKNNIPIYINMKTNEDTIKLYENLKNRPLGRFLF